MRPSPNAVRVARPAAEVRTRLGVSLDDVAKWSGFNRETVRMWEMTSRSKPETHAVLDEVYTVLRTALDALERPRLRRVRSEDAGPSSGVRAREDRGVLSAPGAPSRRISTA